MKNKVIALLLAVLIFLLTVGCREAEIPETPIKNELETESSESVDTNINIDNEEIKVNDQEDDTKDPEKTHNLKNDDGVKVEFLTAYRYALALYFIFSDEYSVKLNACDRHRKIEVIAYSAYQSKIISCSCKICAYTAR